MDQTIRDQKQQEIKEVIQQHKVGIVLVSVRVGKTLATLLALKDNQKVLVCYPRVKIKNGWVSDREEFKDRIASGLDITYSTYNSLHKHALEEYDVVVFDEIQRASVRNLETVAKMNFKKFVGLTGTLSYKSVQLLNKYKVPIVYKYSTEQAIKDGLVKDYKVYIHMLQADKPLLEIERAFAFWQNELTNPNSVYKEATVRWKMGKFMTDRKEYIYRCPLTINYAKKFLEHKRKEKVLCFALRTDVADTLCDAAYHTKSKKEDEFEAFLDSETGHLSTVNCITEGVTIKNLNTVLFQGFDSNTENFQQKFGRSLLQEFTGEYSSIHVICLKGSQQEVWLTKALGDINKNKVSVIEGNSITPYYDWIKTQYPDKKLYEYKNSICWESTPDNYTFLYSYQEYTLNKKLLKAI